MSIDFEIDWDPAFGDPAEGDTLDDEAAGKIILERLNVEWDELDARMITDAGDKIGFPGVNHRRLARNLASLLPDDMRTEMVLRRMDVRALLDAVMSTADNEQDIEVGGVEFSTKERRMAAILYGDYTRRVSGTLQGELVAQGMDPAQAATLAEQQSQFTPGTLRPVSLAVPDPQSYEDTLADEADLRVRAEDGTTRVVSDSPNTGFGDGLDLASLIGGESIERPSFMTQSDFDILFNTDSADQAIQVYLNEMSRRQGFNEERQAAITAGMDPRATPPAPGDGLRIQYRDEQDPARAAVPRGGMMGGAVSDPAYRRAQERWDRKQYTLTQTLTLPNQMSRTELKQLTDRMIEAGLLEESEVAVKGSPTDPGFKRAWRDLISQSVQQDVPMWELLGQQIKMREDAKAAARESFQAKLSDPATIRLTTQALARQIIGRRISDEEASRLVQMVHQWEADAQFAEAEAMSGETTAEDGSIISVDWQSRMEEMLRAENPDEAEAKEQVNQYESFRTMLGGPGYGPTRRGVLS